MIFLAKKKNLLVLIFVLVFIFAVALMFWSNILEGVGVRNSNGDTEVLADIEGRAHDFQAMGEKDTDFFIDYKLERDRLRGQEADYLRELINNPNASSESKEKAQQDLIELSKKVEKEMIGENLIKAKGFDDAILFFSEDFINIVVKSDGLEAKDIAKITDAITKSTGISLDKITIIERK